MPFDAIAVDPTVLGANIIHARKRAGLTQAVLAEAAGLSRPTLVAVEAGQRRPNEAQLAAIARATNSSIRDLLSLGPPDAGLSVRFRALRGAERFENAIAALEDYGRRYARLEELANDRIVRREPPVFSLERIKNIERTADELAATERLRLGLGDGPLPDLRIVFEEDAGLRIFGLDELRQTRVSGIFAYSQEYGPLIGFNVAHDPRRIRWTFCHEYSHYLTARFEPEVTVDHDSTPGRRDRNEVFADAFAARFLMPANGLSRRFSEMLSDAGGELRVAHLLLLSKFFQVSFQALTQRLEEIGRIGRGTYEMLRARGFKAREAEDMLGISRYEGPVDRLPFRYVFLVTTLYAQGLLSEGDVGAFLHTSRLEARAILQRVPEAGDGGLADAGLDTPVEAVG
jgi:Zn-dependent peptidase ImmA (M78 family)/DNA-binding XRE family transcriptional regulator